MVGASLVDSGEVEEEEEKMSQDDHAKVKEGTFQIVGTITNKSEEKNPHVLEEYYVSSQKIMLKLRPWMKKPSYNQDVQMGANIILCNIYICLFIFGLHMQLVLSFVEYLVLTL